MPTHISFPTVMKAASKTPTAFRALMGRIDGDES